MRIKNTISEVTCRKNLVMFCLKNQTRMNIPAGTKLQKIGKIYCYGEYEFQPGMKYLPVNGKFIKAKKIW
jgi:hypothetical protein